MPKRRVEDELLQLGLLRHPDKSDAQVAAALQKALRDPVNAMAAKAADVAAHRKMVQLIPDMLLSYDRLFRDPVKRDPQCVAKNAIAKALKDLAYGESAPFLRGLRHVQMEPVWGGEQDSAAALRGTCAVALVNCLDIPVDAILVELVDAITDSVARVREDAVKAVVQLGARESILLLRLKARVGDEDPAITGLALEGILRLEGEGAIQFVGRFLEAQIEEVRDQAALALGASRLPGAIELLREQWHNKIRSLSDYGILNGLSLSRLESALEFLLGIIRNGRMREAIDAMKVLDIHRGSPDIVERVAAAVRDRPEPEIQVQFEREFLRVT